MNIAQLLERNAHVSDVLEHLDRQVSIPVLSGPQAQGDLMIVPDDDHAPSDVVTDQVPRDGLVVLAGQHAHTLVGDGPVFFTPSADGIRLGWLTVPEGSVGYFIHTEHGGTGLAPRVYRVGRQREWAAEIRMVAD